MSHEIIKIGVLPNDGLGDPLRVAFDKINHNFATLFNNTPGLQYETIETGKNANDGSGDTLTSAFDKLNRNFSNLYTKTPGLIATTFSINDPLRTTFERVNASFNTLFEVLAPNEPIVVEVIAPAVQEVDATSDTSFAGNINITNNYNFYVQNETAQPSATPSLLSGPQSTPLTAIVGPFGVQEYINVGAQPNDGTGDPLRTAFQKINNNFSNLFFTTTTTTSSYTSGTTANQVIFEAPADTFTQGTFQIRSKDVATTSSQDITLTAQIVNGNSGVKFTGYGTTFNGSYVTRYDMDVSGGNVRILVNPLLNTTILHFIASQITYIGPDIVGVDISLDGYANSIMATENNLNIITETP